MLPDSWGCLFQNKTINKVFRRRLTQRTRSEQPLTQTMHTGCGANRMAVRSDPLQTSTQCSPPPFWSLRWLAKTNSLAGRGAFRTPCYPTLLAQLVRISQTTRMPARSLRWCGIRFRLASSRLPSPLGLAGEAGGVGNPAAHQKRIARNCRERLSLTHPDLFSFRSTRADHAPPLRESIGEARQQFPCASRVASRSTVVASSTALSDRIALL